MESHSCTETRGEGVLPEIDIDDPHRCQHIDALGRRCRMFVATPEASADPIDPLAASAEGLCPHHVQRLLGRQRATEATAAELLASVGDFTDAASVNRFLGNLLKLFAVKRIPRKNAVAMAYISQLILNSQAAQDRRELTRLRIAELEAERQKNLPTRVIWDLPLRPKPKPDEQAVSSEEKPHPSEAPQPSPAPAASASAQSDRPAARPLDATPPPPATPASAVTPPPPPGPPNPMNGFPLRKEGHTVDWYAPASWNKPVRRRYPSSRWY